VKISKWAKVLTISTVVLLMVGLSVSCGGGSDNGGGSNIAKKSASSPDEYAGQVCDALSKYVADLETLMNGETPVDDPSQLKDAVSKMAPMFAGISADMKKINPPSDIQDWHNSAVTAFAQAGDLMGQMEKALDKPIDQALPEITDLTTQFSDNSPFDSLGEPPSPYKEAFQTNTKCTELGIFGQ
jgi:hypothetical protein